MRCFVGTSGYSYKEWKGHFYPDDLKPPDMLRHYAERLNAVEINATFYRMPSEKVLRHWAEQVPDGFSFVLKASRRITHQKRLLDAGDPLAYLLKAASAISRSLGPILFQLPPYFKKDVPRLADFLALIPAGWQAAFEFRNESWNDDEVYETLRSHAAALVVADTEEHPAPAVVSTAPYGYFRMRREAYDDAELSTWIRTIRDQRWEQVHVFFKHEDAGAAPRLAARFNELLGAG